VCLGETNIHKHGIVRRCAVFPDENPTVISFSNGIVFDTKKGKPNLPQNLKISHSLEPGYYLIQIKGPIFKEYVNDMKAIGIEVIGYIPKYTLIVYGKHDQIVAAKAKPFVQWTGIFQPAYKLAKELFDVEGAARVVIQLFPIEHAPAIAEQISKFGFEVIEIIDHEICKTIDAHIDLERIDEIAQITGVLWIQLWKEATFCNDNCQWVTQTGWRSSVPSNPEARRVWFSGVVGDGVMLSTTDSGINTIHDQFYDPSHPINFPGVYPNHRKIVAYKLYEGATFGDGENSSWGYHGTHVNCTAAGNDTMLGTSDYDGMAKQARIYFVDVINPTSFVIPFNLAAMYDTIHLGRGLPYTIRQHSASWGWGNTSGTYWTPDATTDAYAYAHPDFLNLYAAGNESNSYRIRNPAIAKNVIAVGATQNSTSSNLIASFSSRGPTQDMRIKPTLMAPGQNIWSAYGSGTSGYISGNGTSMATPAVNGTIALIRQYLLAGYYPSGFADPNDSIRYQSAALLRAMAIVSCDPNVSGWSIPNYNTGWGRIDLDSVLYFAGDNRKLIILDDTIGLSTGQSIIDSFVVNSQIPLRVCLVWTDTAAAPNANPTLVNDLDLELIAPDATYYRGNQYSGGQSTPNPLNWDRVNVEECCRVDVPQTGTWKIAVNGYQVVFGIQSFAYAITGGVEPIIGVTEERGFTSDSQIVCRLLGSITKGDIALEVFLFSKNRVEINIYDPSGRLVTTVFSGELPRGKEIIKLKTPLSSGVYFVGIKTREFCEYKKLLIVK
jgi:subtilisin family serine protease